MKDSISIGYSTVREGRRTRASASVQIRGRGAIVLVVVFSATLLLFVGSGGWLP